MKNKKLIYILILSMLFLISCDIVPGDNDGELIEAVNIGGEQSWGMRAALYERAGLSDLKIRTEMAGMFNLRFSHTDYFYTHEISVEISCDKQEAEIYYTTDGSDPVYGKSTRSNRLYTRPVIIESGDNNEPTVLKAAVFLDEGRVSSDILTHTYFVSSAIDSRFSDSVYVFSITSDPYNLFDYDNGILVGGRLREEFMAANPHHSPIPPDPANFNIRGRAGERPAYVEVLSPQGELLISQSVGVRVRGGWSRDASRKSLALYARSEYDRIFDKFYYDFFTFFNNHGRTSIRGTNIPVSSYTQLVLRNGGNDRGGAHMREEFAQVLAKKAGFLDYKDIAPAAVFLNGEYYGFFWLQQMYPEYYFFDHYAQVAKGDLDIIYWWEMPDGRGVTDDDIFREFEKILDIDNFMQYFAFQIYASNWDWPHNNMKAWRYSGGEGGEHINKYYDGRYRMLLFDVESWGIYGNGYRTRDIGRARDSNAALRNLLQREDMVEKFCNQMWDLINTVFAYDSMMQEYWRIVDLYDDEIQTSIRRGAASMSARGLGRERDYIIDFAENRAEHVIRDMERTFRLSGRVYSISVAGKDGASVKLNTLELSGAGSLYSSYFTEHSVRLSADAQQFDYWQINGLNYDRPDIILSDSMAQNGVIRAELFLK